MLAQFLNTLQSFNLPRGSCIIIGVSGGIDSVALVHLFAQSYDQHHYNLELAHLTHNLRSLADGEQDRSLVQQLAQTYALPLHLHTLAPSNHFPQGKEQYARTYRRNWLLELAQQRHAYVALAHHQDDQVQTIFMRLQQHYPLKGLAGIALHNFPIIRPLLHITKQEIRQYMTQHQYAWQEDSSNADQTIYRNGVRLQQQQLTAHWPTLDADVLHLGQIAQQHQSLLQHLLQLALQQSTYQEEPPLFYYNLAAFKALHSSVQHELIFYWFNCLMRGHVRADYRLPLRFVQSINLKANGSTLLQGHGIIIKRKKSTLFITRST